jgi:hypothetical protein
LGFPRNDILQKRVDRVLVPAPFFAEFSGEGSFVRERVDVDRNRLLHGKLWNCIEMG